MKYAVISDVHANREALEAVLARPEVQRADVILCLGDSVGYHANPNECLEILRERGALSIAGNHDLAAIGALSTENFSRTARVAIEWTAPRLSPDNREYLAGLPITRSVPNEFLCVHAALHPTPNVVLHLSSPARVQASLEKLRELGSSLCFFGHTHWPVVHAYDGERPVTICSSSVELRRDSTYLVNPGSVGQPRDGDARAAYATYDTATRLLRFERVSYDFGAALARARRTGLLQEPTLRERTSDWLAVRANRGRDLAGSALRRRLGQLR